MSEVSASEFLSSILKDGIKKPIKEEMEIVPSKNICSNTDIFTLSSQNPFKI